MREFLSRITGVMRQGSWRSVLLGVAVIQACVLVNIERDRLAEARSIEARLATREGLLAYNPELDPKPGQRLPRLFLKDLSGERKVVPPATPGQQAVVVFVGACSPCVVDKLLSWQEAVSPKRSVYVVTLSDVDEVRHFRERFKIRLPFFFGRSESAQMRHYNVAWRPRAYLLDDTARLVYSQPQFEDSETAKNRVLALQLRKPERAALHKPRREETSHENAPGLGS